MHIRTLSTCVERCFDGDIAGRATAAVRAAPEHVDAHVHVRGARPGLERRAGRSVRLHSSIALNPPEWQSLDRRLLALVLQHPEHDGMTAQVVQLQATAMQHHVSAHTNLCNTCTSCAWFAQSNTHLPGVVDEDAVAVLEERPVGGVERVLPPQGSVNGDRIVPDQLCARVLRTQPQPQPPARQQHAMVTCMQQQSFYAALQARCFAPATRIGCRSPIQLQGHGLAQSMSALHSAHLPETQPVPEEVAQAYEVVVPHRVLDVHEPPLKAVSRGNGRQPLRHLRRAPVPFSPSKSAWSGV